MNARLQKLRRNIAAAAPRNTRPYNNNFGFNRGRGYNKRRGYQEDSEFPKPHSYQDNGHDKRIGHQEDSEFQKPRPYHDNEHNKRVGYQEDSEFPKTQPYHDNGLNKRKGYQEDSEFPRPQAKRKCFQPFRNPPQIYNRFQNSQTQNSGKYSANSRLQSLKRNLQIEMQQHSQADEDSSSDKTHFYDSDASTSSRLSQPQNNDTVNKETHHAEAREQSVDLSVPNYQNRNPKQSSQKEIWVTFPDTRKNKLDLPKSSHNLSNRICRTSTTVKPDNLKPQSELVIQTTSKSSREETSAPVTNIPPLCQPRSLQQRLNRMRRPVPDHVPLTKENNLLERLNSIEPLNTSTFVLEDFGTSNVCRNNKCEEEEMDWCTFDEKEVALELAEIRKNPNVMSADPKTSFQRTVATKAAEIPFNETLYKTIYIVVDTNIFLSHLEVVRKVMQLKINEKFVSGVVTPIVLAPWIVIQELDYIKDGKHKHVLKNKAQNAIRFINDGLVKKLNLTGQSVRDAAQQDFASSNFDDSILHCCMQIRERRNMAILLTNDVNLKNKLLNEDIEAFSHSEIFKRLDPFNQSFPREETDFSEDPKALEMKKMVSHLCTYIILKELRSSYGELWNKMGSTKKRFPWSLQDCLDMFVQFWMPVFGMALSGQCLTHIETFKKSLKARNGKVESTEKLFEFALTLANFLKLGYPSHFNHVHDLVGNLQKTYDS